MVQGVVPLLPLLFREEEESEEEECSGEYPGRADKIIRRNEERLRALGFKTAEEVHKLPTSKRAFLAAEAPVTNALLTNQLCLLERTATR